MERWAWKVDVSASAHQRWYFNDIGQEITTQQHTCLTNGFATWIYDIMCSRWATNKEKVQTCGSRQTKGLGDARASKTDSRSQSDRETRAQLLFVRVATPWSILPLVWNGPALRWMHWGKRTIALSEMGDTWLVEIIPSTALLFGYFSSGVKEYIYLSMYTMNELYLNCDILKDVLLDESTSVRSRDTRSVLLEKCLAADLIHSVDAAARRFESQEISDANKSLYEHADYEEYLAHAYKEHSKYFWSSRGSAYSN